MDRPIIFKEEMVRAVLEGRKTKTRRVMKPQPEAGLEFTPFAPFGVVNGKGNPLICRHGQPGDRLWVRETWCEVDDTDFAGERWVDYRATPKYSASHPAAWENAPDDPEALKWRPSIHMPRWASRITLEITGVRVERLQDISEEDAIAEGARHFPDLPGTSPYGQDDRWSMETPDSCDNCLGNARMAFANYFCKITGNAPKGLLDSRPWDANPWVWVIEFRRVD